MLPDSKDALHVTSRCCASLTSARPLLLETSVFGAIVFCGFDEHIRVYKVADAKGDKHHSTWQWRHWLQLSGHTAPVQDLQASPDSELRLLSCGMDGRLIVWDYATETAESIIEVNAPVLRLLAVPAADSVATLCVLAGAERPASADLDFRLASVAPNGQKRTIFYKMQPSCLSAGHHGRFVAGASLGHVLVYRMAKSKFLSHYICDEASMRITSLAAHPRERTVAAGLSDGRVVLMYNVYSNRRLVRQRLQWHFRSVQCLAFATDGCVLFSGGQEAVLVKWDVSPEGGQSRTFLPRLGAGLSSISCSSSGSVVANLADNSLVVVDSNLEQIGRVHGIFRCDQEAALPFGLVRDPATECVVLNGTPGTVQFYSVSQQRLLGTLDVVKSNYSVVESSLTPVKPAQVELLSFSDKGAWLATFDKREDGRYAADMSLKFWARQLSEDETSNVQFVQVAEENFSERHCLVGMAFQPNSDERKLVCSASDGSLMCWTREDRVCHFGDTSAPVAQWQLSRTWKLGQNFTGGPLNFDPSGRLLLTCHQSQVCGAVWDTEALTEPPAMFFTNGTEPKAAGDADVAFCSLWDDGRSVLVCRHDLLCIWDRKTCALLARSPLTLKSVVEDQKSGMVIACCADNSLLMVHSAEPAELIRIPLLCPAPPRHLCVTEDTFVFLTEDHRLFLYPEPAQDAMEAPVIKETGGRDLLPGQVSLLSRVFQREPNYADQLERRLRLFASADAFAAPNLGQFAAQNLQLMRHQLLLKSAAPLDDPEEQPAPADLNWKLLDRQEDSDVEEAQPQRPMEFEDVGTAAYEKSLLRCLRRLCIDSQKSLPSMKELRRQRKQQRRLLKSLTSDSDKVTSAQVASAQVASAQVASAPVQQVEQEDDLIFVSAEPPPPVDVDQPDSESLPVTRLANGSLSVDLDEETVPNSRRRKPSRKRRLSRNSCGD